MRGLIEGVCVALLLGAGACAAEDVADVSTAEQEVRQDTGEGEIGEQDVPLDDDGTLVQHDTSGARHKGEAPDAAYGRRLGRYESALRRNEADWRRSGRTQAEMDELGGALKAEILGERP
ncbi:MAG: hypothetical protein KC464_13435 [Myxococcales bacterium]|nr:hypothetical protein [Myxococcales bacterium]